MQYFSVICVNVWLQKIGKLKITMQMQSNQNLKKIKSKSFNLKNKNKKFKTLKTKLNSAFHKHIKHCSDKLDKHKGSN